MAYGHEYHCPHPGYPCKCKMSKNTAPQGVAMSKPREYFLVTDTDECHLASDKNHLPKTYTVLVEKPQKLASWRVCIPVIEKSAYDERVEKLKKADKIIQREFSYTLDEVLSWSEDEMYPDDPKAYEAQDGIIAAPIVQMMVREYEGDTSPDHLYKMICELAESHEKLRSKLQHQGNTKDQKFKNP